MKKNIFYLKIILRPAVLYLALLNSFAVFSAVPDSLTEAGALSCNEECQKRKLNLEIQRMAQARQDVLKSKPVLSKKEILEKLKSGEIVVSQVVALKDKKPACAMTADDSTTPDFASPSPKGFKSSIDLNLPACNEEDKIKVAKAKENFVAEGEQMALLPGLVPLISGCAIGVGGAYAYDKYTGQNMIKDQISAGRKVVKWFKSDEAQEIKTKAKEMKEASQPYVDRAVESGKETYKEMAEEGKEYIAKNEDSKSFIYGAGGAIIVIGGVAALKKVAAVISTAVMGAGYLVCGTGTAYTLEFINKDRTRSSNKIF